MPSYKLTYFSFKGVAEPIRLILSYGGVDFEDERLDRENWLPFKPLMPFGQVPTLEVDGKRAHQSEAIARYLAKQFGIAGKDDWEALEIDATVATISDLRLKLTAWQHENILEAKEAKYDRLFKEIIPYYLERLNAQVKDNGGYFVGGALTWADLFFVGLLEYINYMAKYDIIEKYENLERLRATVLELPKIKAWVKRRPVSDR